MNGKFFMLDTFWRINAVGSAEQHTVTSITTLTTLHHNKPPSVEILYNGYSESNCLTHKELSESECRMFTSR